MYCMYILSAITYVHIGPNLYSAILFFASSLHHGVLPYFILGGDKIRNTSIVQEYALTQLSK